MSKPPPRYPNPTEVLGVAFDINARKASEALTREIADILKKIMPAGCGFLFMIANQGDEGWMTYAASIARGDAVKMLRDLAGKLEAGTVQ